MKQVDILIGGDCMALYVEGLLVTAATRLSFSDILEGIGQGFDLREADLVLYDEPEKFPPKLDQVMEYEETT